MKSAKDWAKEILEIGYKIPVGIPERLEYFTEKVRRIRIDALLHAANLARLGRMNGVRNERDRGHNLALDIMVENLEQRKAKPRMYRKGAAVKTLDDLVKAITERQYFMLGDRPLPPSFVVGMTLGTVLGWLYRDKLFLAVRNEQKEDGDE